MSVRVAVYDKATGQIRQVSLCHPDDQDDQHLAFGDGFDFVVLPIDAHHMTGRNTRIDLATLQPVPFVCIESTRRETTKALERDCAAAIMAGFAHDGRHYPANLRDQQNMQQAAVMGGKLHCATGDVWDLRDHTAEEAQAVLGAFTAHKDAAREKVRLLLAQVADAADADAITNIKWETP